MVAVGILCNTDNCDTALIRTQYRAALTCRDAHVNRLIAGCEVVRNLSPIGDVPNLEQTRELEAAADQSEHSEGGPYPRTVTNSIFPTARQQTANRRWLFSWMSR